MLLDRILAFSEEKKKSEELSAHFTIECLKLLNKLVVDNDR